MVRRPWTKGTTPRHELDDDGVNLFEKPCVARVPLRKPTTTLYWWTFRVPRRSWQLQKRIARTC